MLYQITKRLDEASQYLEHIGTRLQKDQKLASAVSLEELNTDKLKEAVHYLHLALAGIQEQKKLNLEYQASEEEREEKEPVNRLSRRVDERI